MEAPEPEDHREPKLCKKDEVPFHEVDNPGKWLQYAFKAVFEKREKKYLHHAMASGATPVSEDQLQRREVGRIQVFLSRMEAP